MNATQRIERAEEELRLAKEQLVIESHPKSLIDLIEKTFRDSGYGTPSATHNQYEGWECYKSEIDEVILRTEDLTSCSLWAESTYGQIEGHKIRSILVTNNMLYLYLER